MSTVQIRRREDTTQVTRLQLGLLDERSPELVGPGDVVDVPAEIAGEAPHWRPVADGEQSARWQETRLEDGVMQVRDLGHGLLSQEGNWEPVEKPDPPKKTAAKKKPAETGEASTEGQE